MTGASARFTPLDRSEYHGLQMRLVTDMRHFGTYRSETATFLRHHLECEEAVADLVLALDEACTNVVRHSYGGSTDRCFYLKVVVENWSEGPLKLLTITLRDQGPGGQRFSPDRSVAEAAARCASGELTGFGLVMLYKLMDQVEYAVDQGGENRLIMRKFFPSDQDYQYLARLIGEIHGLNLADGPSETPYRLPGSETAVREQRVPPAGPRAGLPSRCTH